MLVLCLLLVLVTVIALSYYENREYFVTSNINIGDIVTCSAIPAAFTTKDSAIKATTPAVPAVAAVPAVPATATTPAVAAVPAAEAARRRPDPPR